jgi:hypothetical protein
MAKKKKKTNLNSKAITKGNDRESDRWRLLRREWETDEKAWGDRDWEKTFFGGDLGFKIIKKLVFIWGFQLHLELFEAVRFDIVQLILDFRNQNRIDFFFSN